MQFINVALFICAVVGVAAMPVDSESSGISARDNGIHYTGKCYRGDNTCRFSREGRTTIVKCPKYANKKCTHDGARCTYDSYDGKVICD